MNEKQMAAVIKDNIHLLDDPDRAVELLFKVADAQIAALADTPDEELVLDDDTAYKAFRDYKKPEGYQGWWDINYARAISVAKAQLAKAKPVYEARMQQAVKAKLVEVEATFVASNYLSPEAGREPVNAIRVKDWQALKG